MYATIRSCVEVVGYSELCEISACVCKARILLTILHSRISGGSSSLMRATKFGTPGILLMSFMETTFPAA